MDEESVECPKCGGVGCLDCADAGYVVRQAADLDADIWGPTPPRWRVLEAQFWGWRKKQWWRLLRNTVCFSRPLETNQMEEEMAVVKKQQVVEYMYQLTLSKYEMEVLFVILASVASASVWESMKDYGFTPDDSVDTPYNLYEVTRDALEVNIFQVGENK